jgi:coenzyme F420-reducing hydrogenase gamma subunit
MRYLGLEPEKPRVAVFDFTGCEGCELQLSNKEHNLAAFLSAIDIVAFREVSSEASEEYDIAFLDGAISRDDEVERLKRIRDTASIVVAMGSCACFGGVNRQKNAYDLDEANREVYGDMPKETRPVRAMREIINVDLEIPGCPVNKDEIERVVQHVVLGVPYQPPVYPVCVDCKHRFVSCLMDKGQLCLGSVSRAGCDAPCPAGGLGCWGCRGPAEDCNIEELVSIATQHGHTDQEIKERLAFFGGFEGAL